MIVFIDESGCPGFKITLGSDPIFAVGMVMFSDSEEARQTDEVVRDLHKTLGHGSEFKFSKCSDDVRDGFFCGVANSPFKVCAVVVRKELIYSEHLRADHDCFYNYFLRLLMTHKDRLAGAKVRLDGSGGRDFQRALSGYLRRQLGQPIKDLRMVDSKRDNLAQLADMCIGAIARSYRDRKDPARWRNMLVPQTTSVRKFR